MALSAEVEAKYVVIIDTILASSDLNTISEKRIRKGLQQAVDYDITPQKDVIKPLIMARFDKFMAEQSTQTQANGHTTVATASPEATPSHTSPTPRSASKGPSVEAEESSEVVDTHTKKKRKRSPLDEDAVFAARLQAEENSRARPTRGGGVTKKVVPAKKKKTPKKKTADRVDAADDSELDSESAEKKVNRSGGFHRKKIEEETKALEILSVIERLTRVQKPLTLSAPLSALLDGEHQTVKRIWEYVREHDLQDPGDKRWIRCDDALKAVFKSDKVHMFTMNKLLAQNLYNPDE
ncbi:MAG: hypothetical protein LQ350_007919 [Teloschistes chrysophthalmus]|nr:MAG: hypothetical protein LQ350_007919 [Niorma chrysophthalma]